MKLPIRIFLCAENTFQLFLNSELFNSILLSVINTSSIWFLIKRTRTQTFLKLVIVNNYRLISFELHWRRLVIVSLSSSYLSSKTSLPRKHLFNLRCYPMNTNIYNDLIEITSDWSPEIIFLLWYLKELTGIRASSIQRQFNNRNWSIYRCTNINLVSEVLILLKWHIPKPLNVV